MGPQCTEILFVAELQSWPPLSSCNISSYVTGLIVLLKMAEKFARRVVGTVQVNDNEDAYVPGVLIVLALTMFDASTAPHAVHQMHSTITPLATSFFYSKTNSSLCIHSLLFCCIRNHNTLINSLLQNEYNLRSLQCSSAFFTKFESGYSTVFNAVYLSVCFVRQQINLKR